MATTSLHQWYHDCSTWIVAMPTMLPLWTSIVSYLQWSNQEKQHSSFDTSSLWEMMTSLKYLKCLKIIMMNGKEKLKNQHHKQVTAYCLIKGWISSIMKSNDFDSNHVTAPLVPWLLNWIVATSTIPSWWTFIVSYLQCSNQKKQHLWLETSSLWEMTMNLMHV